MSREERGEGARRTIRSSEGQRGADKMREAGRGAEKKGKCIKKKKGD